MMLSADASVLLSRPAWSGAFEAYEPLSVWVYDPSPFPAALINPPALCRTECAVAW